jgi:hypothetical protein
VHEWPSGCDGLYDIVIAGTAAKVTLKAMTYLLFGKAVWMGFDKIDCAHHHSGRTVTALKRMMLPKHFLHRMQRTISVHQSLDRRKRSATSLNGQHRARFNGHSVDIDNASPALACIAANMSAGQAQFITE